MTFLHREVKFRLMNNLEATEQLRSAVLTLVFALCVPSSLVSAQVVDVYEDDEQGSDGAGANDTPPKSPPVSLPQEGQPSAQPQAHPKPQATPQAQPKADPAESDLEKARAHLALGRQYYAEGAYGKAGEEFEKAFGARPVPAFQYNAGIAHERDGNFPRAIAHFQRYLDLAPDVADADAIRERLERLKKGVALAQAARPTDIKSIIYVRTEPEGAKVAISYGGQVVSTGTTPHQVEFDQSGRYTIEIEKEGFEKMSQTVEAEVAKDVIVAARLGQGFLGQMEITSDPPEANVYVNDKALGVVGKTPFYRTFELGKYHVWVEKPGYETQEFDLELAVDHAVQQEVKLERVSYGRLRVVSNVRGSEVFVDGEKVGVVETSAVLVDVPAGDHIVSVSAEDMKTYEIAVNIKRGKETPIRVKLLPAVDRSNAWVTGGLAVLLIGGGITVGLIGEGIKSDLEADRDAGLLRQDDSRIDLGFWLQAGADIAFGLGAVLAAFSTYYFLSDPLPESEGEVLLPRDWTLTPQLGPGFAGASLGGSF